MDGILSSSYYFITAFTKTLSIELPTSTPQSPHFKIPLYAQIGRDMVGQSLCADYYLILTITVKSLKIKPGQGLKALFFFFLQIVPITAWY